MDDDTPMTEEECVEVMKGAIDDLAAFAPIHDPVELQRFLGKMSELIVKRAFTVEAEGAEPDA